MKKLFTLFLVLIASIGTISASVSVTDNSIADWDNLPQQYVFEAACPAGAAYLGLRSVKVYADLTYINILVEPDMNELPDLEWVPFHVIIDTDNSDATGGYGDMWNDANTDILMEGAVFVEDAPCAYEPDVFAWAGEVGGTGWSWEQLTVAAPFCQTQHVGNYIEFKMVRELIPTTAGWNVAEFGIGFDIQQSWEPVGVLPLVSPTDNNPGGHTVKMKVTIDASSEGSSDGVTIDGINYLLNVADQTAQVIRNEGASGSVVIPSTITSNDVTYSVTSIGTSAFHECTGLTSVTIPNSVTSIGDGAFASCEGLVSVTIPNSVTSIGILAFTACYGLTTMIIPNSVTSIGEMAFSACIALTSVTIPNSVTYFGEDAFYGCISLTSVTLNSNAIVSKNYSYSSNMKNIFGEQVTEYVIGEDVTSIGNYAFRECGNLTSVTIGNSVTSIGNQAFYKCTNLTSVTIGNSVTSIGTSAFAGCTGLTAIELPNSVTSIGNGIFGNCSSLTRLVVLNKNIRIESEDVDAPFALATNLTYISAPACIFDVSTEYTNYPSYFSQKLDTIEVTNGELTGNALWMINLSRKTLKSVDLSGTTQTELAEEAFKGFYNLQSLALPANLTKIGYMSVAECKNLQSISIPASVTEISQSAFENCRSLSSIDFGEGSQLQTIGNWAFYNAHALTNLSLPESVQYIGDGAFYGCNYLEHLSMPASMHRIGDHAFALCEHMSSMMVEAVVPPVADARSFYGVNRTIPVYVPDQAVNDYRNAPVWQEFFICPISEAPSGINNTFEETMPTKFLSNGQVLILRGDKTFTVTGQEVK